MKYEVKWYDRYNQEKGETSLEAKGVKDLLNKLEIIAFDHNVGTIDFFIQNVKSEEGQYPALFGSLDSLLKKGFHDAAIKDKSSDEEIKAYIEKLHKLLPNAANIYAVSHTGVSITMPSLSSYHQAYEKLKSAGYNVEEWDDEDFELIVWSKTVTFDSASVKDKLVEPSKELINKVKQLLEKAGFNAEFKGFTGSGRAEFYIMSKEHSFTANDHDALNVLGSELEDVCDYCEKAKSPATFNISFNPSKHAITGYFHVDKTYIKDAAIKDDELGTHKINIKELRIKSIYEIMSWLDQHDVAHEDKQNEIIVKTDANTWRMFIQQCGSMHGVKLEDSKNMSDLSKIYKIARSIPVTDDRLSPMTYKKLKELGYDSDDWKDLSQEQANEIIHKGDKKGVEKSGKKEEPKKEEPKKQESKEEDFDKAIDNIFDMYKNAPINEIDEEHGMWYIDFTSPSSYRKYKEATNSYNSRYSGAGPYGARLYFDHKEDLAKLLKLKFPKAFGLAKKEEPKKQSNKSDNIRRYKYLINQWDDDYETTPETDDLISDLLDKYDPDEEYGSIDEIFDKLSEEDQQKVIKAIEKELAMENPDFDK